MKIQLRREIDGYLLDNPAIVALRYALENRVQLAEQLGGKPAVDLDSFLDVALDLEPVRGNA